MKVRIILAVLSLLLFSPSFAQRRNARGLKMVKTLNLRWYDYDGEPIFQWLCWNIRYYYDENGKLIGLDKKWTEKGSHCKEEYRLDSTNLDRKGNPTRVIGTTYKDGKVMPLHKIQLSLDKHYRIEEYPVYQNGEILYIGKKVHIYNTSGKVYHTYVKTFSERVYEQMNLPETMRRFQSDVDFSKRDPGLSDYERDLGFTRDSPRYLFTKDKVCNEEWRDNDLFEHRFIVFIDGNMQDLRYVNARRMYNEYLERENDTNVEFYGFGKMTEIPSSYKNIEWSTEWLKTRSKNLLSMEGRWGKSFDGKWEYVFDNQNNIRQIVIWVDAIAKKNKCVIDIEYVY